MRGVKTYLAIVTVLLLVALGFGVYIWYLLQTLDERTGTSLHDAADTAVPSEEAPISRDERPNESTDSAPMDDEPIVIDVSALSPTQREALETVGFTGTTLTITGALRVCVEESLGTERLDAVAKGSVPSPLEVVKLMPCLRK